MEKILYPVHWRRHPLRHTWRRQWHPTPVLLPGKTHGQRSLVGCSPWGCKESDTTERLHFHFSLSCIGEGHGNPLQCSCLENPRDGGAWRAAIYGIAQSQTRQQQQQDTHTLYFTVQFSSVQLLSQWTPGVGDGQGGLACCNSWGLKKSDRTERLNWTEGHTNSNMTMWLHTFRSSQSTKLISLCYTADSC